ncbi:MAG: TRAFs-binding domain-containing protein, partial [Gammaproteobacteria bacterium]
YLAFSEKALEIGHPSLAFDVLKEGISRFPDHPEMIYRASLALARGGSTQIASDLLKPLLQDLKHDNPVYIQVLSLAGRLAKDRYMKLTTPLECKDAAQESASFYKQAYESSNDYYPGINAATMSLVAGNETEGKRIAEQIKSDCESLWDESGNDYWLAATLGEAYLLVDLQDKAAGWYEKAAKLAQGRYGDLASIRRQVNILSNRINVDPAIFNNLKIPKVLAFTGHMIDSPNRPESRFSEEIADIVSNRLIEKLGKLDAGFGYCSAACGSDILFIEAMLERGSEVHVVLPFNREEFMKTSVAFAGDHWVQRFNHALQQVTSIQYATEEGYLGDDVLFEYCNDLIQGMALLRARQLETEPVLLAVREPDTLQKAGGTLAFIKHWEALDYALETIELKQLREDTQKQKNTGLEVNKQQKHIHNNDQDKDATHISRMLRTMIFADVVGFSKLDEEAAPSFFVDFLHNVAEVIRESSCKPSFCNTWGDGLFMVFDNVVDAADFSLRLRDMILARDWAKVGLPEDTSIRIGLHSGPVYGALDPIIQKNNYYGSHVNRAARIEPIATPGAVFMSEQTACLLAASGNTEYECDYLGIMELAKKFGHGVLYRLRRANQVE